MFIILQTYDYLSDARLPHVGTGAELGKAGRGSLRRA